MMKVLSKEKKVFLGQLINSLEEVGLKLEEYYEKKDNENFNNSKKLMNSILKKILDNIK